MKAKAPPMPSLVALLRGMWRDSRRPHPKGARPFHHRIGEPRREAPEYHLALDERRAFALEADE